MARKRTSQNREPLSRARVLKAAVELADTGGIAALSMRKLGHALGVEAMSLYNYVANKEEILDGIIDLVLGEIAVPDATEAWKTALRKRAYSTREVYRRHPWAIGMPDTRTTVIPSSLVYHEAMAGCLRNGGFPLELIIDAISTMDSLIYGIVLREIGTPFVSQKELEASVGALLKNFPMTQYPNLAKLIPLHVKRVGVGFNPTFEFGVDLILRGIEQMLREYLDRTKKP